MVEYAQRSFAKGEISPALYARADLQAFAAGLEECLNFQVRREGGLVNRPGFEFITEVKYSSKTTVLIKFVFNAGQTYIIEVGDGYMRFIRNAIQLTTSVGITTASWSGGTATITTSADHGYLVDTEVTISGVDPSGYNVTGAITSVGSSTTFDIAIAGDPGAYSSGGTVVGPYEIATPYLEADLESIQHKYVQSGDIITIVHPAYAPRNLSRTGHTSWSLDLIDFVPATAQPDGGDATTGGGTGENLRWRVTAVDPDTSEESLPGYEAVNANPITNISQADPAVVDVTAHGYTTGDEVFIAGVVGMTEVNDRKFIVGATNANDFELEGEDSTGHTLYSSDGTVARTSIGLDNVGVPSDTNNHTLSWDAVAGVSEYNVYRSVSGIYGFVGSAGTNAYTDVIGSPDTTLVPPVDYNPFDGAGNFPSAVSYFQQRRVYANTDNNPEQNWLSRIGSFNNMSRRSPLQVDDGFSFKLNSREVQEVHHLFEVRLPLVMTEGAIWALAGDADGRITSTLPNARLQSGHGTSEVRPVVVGNSVIYVQARGTALRDLRFTNGADGYDGDDLTVVSSHLFDGFTVKQMDYQQIPHSVIWVVRSDGVLLGLTYLREHKIAGWHRHVTDGLFESVATVPEGERDHPYVVVNRTVNGSTKRYIERMASRRVTDVTLDAKFLDSFLTYDGRNAGGTTMTLTTGAGWTVDDTLTLTASGAQFTAGDVGNSVEMTIGSDTVQLDIEGYSSSTVVTGKPTMNVPVGLQGIATTTWTLMVDELSGLDHLEAKSIMVLGDGNAEGPYVVTAGAVTLQETYGVIHAGIGYTSQLTTLRLDVPGGESLIGRKKIVKKLTAFVDDTRGLWAGPTTDDLSEAKPRDEADGYDAIGLTTGTIDLHVDSRWNDTGQMVVQQPDPLPISILSLVPEFDLEDAE